jgi:hypothetical protein
MRRPRLVSALLTVGECLQNLPGSRIEDKQTFHRHLKIIPCYVYLVRKGQFRLNVVMRFVYSGFASDDSCQSYEGLCRLRLFRRHGELDRPTQLRHLCPCFVCF